MTPAAAPLPIAPPAFPGATLVLDGEGQIAGAWLGPASPLAHAEGDVFAALGLDGASTEAAQIQLLLAAACGAPAAAWDVVAADAPCVLAGRGATLVVQWSPVIAGGCIAHVAGFISAAAVTASTAVAPVDPEEHNRICVEALGLLDECDACLRHLRRAPSARHAVHRLFRAVHTIKGGCGHPALDAVAELAHHTEDLLARLRQSDDRVPRGTQRELGDQLRRLRAAVVAARPRGIVDDAMTELSAELRPALADLEAALSQLPDAAAVAAGVRAIDRLAVGAERGRFRALGRQVAASRNALSMIGEAAPAAPDPGLVAEVRAAIAQVELYVAIYRDVAATDAGPSTLITLASWMTAPEDRSGTFDGIVDVMSQAGVPSLIAAFVDEDPYASRRALAALTDAAAMFEPARPRDDASLRFERAQRDLLAAVDDLAREVPPARLDEVRAIVHRLVWTPIAALTPRLARMARTLGAELGKQLAASIDLGDALVAPEIARIAGEILIHAVRNAADHGIESPAARTLAGKDPAGVIRVTTEPAADHLAITVTDDGRGIDPTHIRELAIERGFLARDATPTAQELLDLLFAPGFSTASAVTAVSGRGVGMDVIKSLVEEHGGAVALTTQLGAGTTLRFTLPYAPGA